MPLVMYESRRWGIQIFTRKGKTLELAFDSQALRAVCESEAHANLKLGAKVTEVLRRRLADMRAAVYAKDLLAGRPRVGPDGKHMVIDLCDGYRIVFQANHVKNPVKDSNDIDWARVTRIKILRIENAYA